MYRIIIIFFIILLLQLHVVKSKQTLEFFKKVCKKPQSCDPKFVADTLNHMHKRIDKLGIRVKTDILGLRSNARIPAAGRPTKNVNEIAKMMNWYDIKTGNAKRGSLYLNKDGSAKSPAQIRKEQKKLRILQRKTALRMRKAKIANKKAAKKPQTPSEKVANRLVTQTINSRLKDAAYIDLLNEYVDLASGNIIKDDEELNDKMKEIMEEEYNDKERAKFKSLFGIVGLSGEDLDDEIKNKKTEPILNLAKARARNLAVSMRYSKSQLKMFITTMKKKEVESAKKEHGNIDDS